MRLKKVWGAAVLISGLLFCCPKVEAYDKVLPKEGFPKYLAEIECEPIYPLEPYHKYFFTEEDADIIKRVAVLEAGEVDVDGIANVMQVVLNRFESNDFPNTISGVIYQKKQFSTAKRLAKANVTEAAEEALEKVCNGDYTDNEALYFESMPGKVWSNIHDYQFSYGGHDFYK